MFNNERFFSNFYSFSGKLDFFSVIEKAPLNQSLLLEDGLAIGTVPLHLFFRKRAMSENVVTECLLAQKLPE